MAIGDESDRGSERVHVIGRASEKHERPRARPSAVRTEEGSSVSRCGVAAGEEASSRERGRQNTKLHPLENIALIFMKVSREERGRNQPSRWHYGT